MWALEISGGEIVGMSSIVNPDKLGHLGPVADAYALLQRGALALRGSGAQGV